MDAFSNLIVFALAFLLGSIPFGFLAGKMRGVDIRKLGSGNIGATNVFRTVGKGPGLAVFLLDAAKGALAVWLTTVITPTQLAPGASMVIAGLLAILGHNFSPWMAWKGGKGIATSAGVLIAVAPWAVLVIFVVWLIVFKLSHYVSLASVLAAMALPLAVWILQWRTGTFDMWILGFAVLAALLAVWRHRSNIQRLRDGTEPQIGGKASKEVR